MLTGVLFWIAAAAAALPLGGQTVCEIEECSFSDGGRNTHTLIQRLFVERQDPGSGSSSSSGPALGVILGGVFGALGGLAIAGILFYAWWSVRRMRRKYDSESAGGSSGPVSSTSRGSPADVAKVPRPQDDQRSDSSAIPLKPIYPSDDRQ
ncbi:hypothetical protein RSAG8_03822, partial [Rhizoctonia solani AG-8 WAC10335]